MDFGELVNRAAHVRGLYADLEAETFGRSWTNEEIALGFVGDVGDLMKLVMAENGIRQIPDAKQKLAHELADCLWSTIILAQAFEIDLESSFISTMDHIEQHIIERLDGDTS
jgi:NTP pyrophosphatase (non-canonical NTP hydrolase)